MTYYQVIQNALDMYYHKDYYAYFYGAKGQRLTDSTMDYLIQAEPDYFKQYSAQQITDIKNYSRNKIGIDCSGFINLVSGVTGYSSLLYETAPVKTTPKNGVEGSILYTTFGGTGRHIGLDIGYGYFLHSPKEGRTIELGKISEYAWEQSGQLVTIDYTGSKA